MLRVHRGFLDLEPPKPYMLETINRTKNVMYAAFSWKIREQKRAISACKSELGINLHAPWKIRKKKKTKNVLTVVVVANALFAVRLHGHFREISAGFQEQKIGKSRTPSFHTHGRFASNSINVNLAALSRLSSFVLKRIGNPHFPQLYKYVFKL